MTDDDGDTDGSDLPSGFRIALAIIGVAILIAVVGGGLLVGIDALLFADGTPCHDEASLTVPGQFQVNETPTDATVLVADNDSRFTRENTDAVTVLITDSRTNQTYQTNWSVYRDYPITGGDELRIRDGAVPFDVTPSDTIIVRWTGYEPNLAEYCPNREQVQATLAKR